jgi:toxin ParE1/3/4
MTNKSVEIHPAAIEELQGAIAWYLDRSRAAAANFAAEVERAIEQVSESPGRWPRGKWAARRFILRRFPFVIVYRETETTIQVVAIAHGRRRPGYWKQRL